MNVLSDSVSVHDTNKEEWRMGASLMNREKDYGIKLL